jgi:hypothetical protein
MGLKILTTVKLFLYDCQNNFLTLPDPSSPGFRAIHGPGAKRAGDGKRGGSYAAQ